MRLSTGLRKSYNTSAFCKNFVDYDGQPVNTAEQQDVYLFAGQIFSQLERALPALDSLVNAKWRGTLAYETTSLECDYSSVRALRTTWLMFECSLAGREHAIIDRAKSCLRDRCEKTISTH